MWSSWRRCYSSIVLDADVPVRARVAAGAHTMRPAHTRNRIHHPAPSAAVSGNCPAPGKRPRNGRATGRPPPRCAARPRADSPA